MAVDDYSDLFDAAAREWRVDPHLLRAMAERESAGDPRAVSKAGARGLMQFMPDTAKAVGVRDPHDPAQAIFGAAKLMSQLLDKYGDPAHALMAYGSGQGSVDSWLRGAGPEPRYGPKYVEGVLGHYKRFAGAGAGAAL